MPRAVAAILEDVAEPLRRLPEAKLGDPSPVLDAIAALTKHLPETDGEPLESPWHVAAISLLIQILTYLWRDRDDFYVGGNMFVYYRTSRRRDREFRGPDFYYVSGVERHRPRDFWAVWEENAKFPEVIVEFLSSTTAETDRTTKKELYEKTFRTDEYFCYDPDTHRLEGWRLHRERYRKITPDEHGRMWSKKLGLWLGNWTGEFHGLQEIWLRFYDAEGRLVLLEAEAERQRAQAAEEEVARLKALLARKGGGRGTTP
jgi:Uma2 family endonuclease